MATKNNFSKAVLDLMGLGNENARGRPRILLLNQF